MIGLIEGEGTIGVTPFQNGRYWHRGLVFIELLSTDSEIIDAVQAIYTKLGIKFRRSTRKLSHTAKGHKTPHIIRIWNSKDLALLVPLLENHLISEHRRKQLVRLKSRLIEIELRKEYFSSRTEWAFDRLSGGLTTRNVAEEMGIPYLTLLSALNKDGYFYNHRAHTWDSRI